MLTRLRGLLGLYVAGAALIEYIHERCLVWGSQQRWVIFGKDGWPSRSMLGKLIEEGALGASTGRFVQTFPEVLSPEALEINNALKALRELYREILFVQYVVTGKAKYKAQQLDIGLRTYYDRVDCAHGELARSLYECAARISQNRAGILALA